MSRRAKCLFVFIFAIAFSRKAFCAIQLNGSASINFGAGGLIIATNTTAASLSVTVNPLSTADSRILSFGSGGGSSTFCILWGRTSNKYSCFGRTSGAGLIQLDSNDTYSTGVYHNVICTGQQSNLSIYVDGIFEGSNATFDTGQTFGAISVNTSSTCILGQAVLNAGAFLTGTVDDVRVYSRVLSSSEISTLGKSHERVLITDGYAAYWPLDNGAYNASVIGPDVLDRSGKGNVGFNVAGTPKWIGSSYVSYP